jgi:hypothetical protein
VDSRDTRGGYAGQLVAEKLAGTWRRVGYDRELGRLGQLLGTNDVTFVPGLNEEAAATSVQGSQLACTIPGATRDGVLGHDQECAA